MNHSPYYAIKYYAWQLARRVSSGAQITLVSGGLGYTASFDCALKCHEVFGLLSSELGQIELQDFGQDEESIPVLTIPISFTANALAQLSKQFSVALVDFAMVDKDSRFFLIWKIHCANSASMIMEPAIIPPFPVKQETKHINLNTGKEIPKKVSTDVNDY